MAITNAIIKAGEKALTKGSTKALEKATTKAITKATEQAVNKALTKTATSGADLFIFNQHIRWTHNRVFLARHQQPQQP